MTDPGIAVIESQARGSLKRACDNGILIESTIVVTVPARECHQRADAPRACSTT
jgi:hypothetical protein